MSRSIRLSKPIYVEAKTREELISKITRGVGNWSVGGSARNRGEYSAFVGRGDKIIVYNIHKQRVKKSPDHKRVVRESKWYGYSYIISYDLLRVAKKFYLKQHTRHFTLNVTL